jgi:hypothetical protein
MATYTNKPGSWTNAQLDAYFAALAAQADAEWSKFMGNRIPIELASQYTTYLGSISVPQTGPLNAVVANGGSVVVHSLADTNLSGSPGTATVAGGALSKVNLTV